jgi:hypothetical protein
MRCSACSAIVPDAKPWLSWRSQNGRPLRGSDAGGERAAAIYSLVDAAKLNGLDPQTYPRDVLARITLNQTVVVDNKSGASQRLALSEVKRAKPDGLTLVLANNTPFTLFPHAFKKLEFDPVKDFTPIGRVATFDLCVAVGPKAPLGGIKELMAWAKANPKEPAGAQPKRGQLNPTLRRRRSRPKDGRGRCFPERAPPWSRTRGRLQVRRQKYFF